MPSDTLSAARLIMPVVFCLGFAASPSQATAEEAARSLDLPGIFASDTFAADMPVAIKWLSSGTHYAQLAEGMNGQRIERRTVAGEVAEIIELSAIAGLPADFKASDYEWQPDAGRV